MKRNGLIGGLSLCFVLYVLYFSGQFFVLLEKWEMTGHVKSEKCHVVLRVI